MATKVIQVPLEEGLLDALNSTSRRRGQTRSELIHEACKQYLTQIEQEELDEAYEQGYKCLPEEPALGEAQAALGGQLLSQESW